MYSVSIAENKFGCFKEISTSSFKLNGQILSLLVTFHQYGTFEVQYNSVFGDHMEPILTVCWLFLQASVRNEKNSHFINRNQSIKYYTACKWIFDELQNTITKYKFLITKIQLSGLAKSAVNQWDSVSFDRDKRMAIHCGICDPVVPWEDVKQHPPASSAVRYSSVAADRCCRTQQSHSETNRGASWIHWSVLCLLFPVSFCLLPYGDWKKKLKFWKNIRLIGHRS